MNNRAALAQLTACLRGEIPAAADWAAILMLANRALITAQLYAAIVRANATQHLPDDAHSFLREVFDRNRERNRRLSAQLSDGLRALNDAGIEPVLLKGAAVWASCGRGLEFNRILADIDLLVRPIEVEPALAALINAGFECVKKYPGNKEHVVAELGRPTDVGFLDLHQRLPGPRAIAEIPDLHAHCSGTIWEEGRAKIPDPAIQIFCLSLHDHFHDQDYWRGGFDLRHLLDIAALCKAPGGVDWLQLEKWCRTSLVRNGLEAQLIAAERLVDAAVPARFVRRQWTQIHHRRHMWQFAYPALAVPLGFLGLAAEGPNFFAHHLVKLAVQRGLIDAKADASGPRLVRLRRRVRRIRKMVSRPPGKL